MIEGVDYAWARPDLDQLWAAGKRFVCRYLAQLPNGKVLGDSERRALHAKGFAIVLNWEQSAGDMLKGSAVGIAHAREALRQANALGAPADAVIYFSCDVDTTSATQRAAVASYLDGAASVLGRARVGVYGEYEVIETMLPTHAMWGWQTYAWSGGRISSKAHLLQYRNGVQVGGGDCDLDRALTADFGQWPRVATSSVRRGDTMFMIRKDDETSVDIYDDNGHFRWHVQNEPERDWFLKSGMQFYDGCSPELYAALTTVKADVTVTPTPEQWASLTAAIVEKLGSAAAAALSPNKLKAGTLQAFREIGANIPPES